MNNFWNFQENLPNNKSKICRICAKESEYGQKLFNSNSEIQRIAVQICSFISIKLEKIQIYPNWICPGCQLQFQATYHFFQIIRNSQHKLDELRLSQKPERKPKPKRVHLYTVDADQVDGPSYDNLKVGDKRISKTPKKFKDSMQGNELEDLYNQIGITKRKTRQCKTERTETIAHIEDQDGFRLGEMISIAQESNRTTTRYQCDFCKKNFVREIAFYNHLSFHTDILYECNECKAVFQSKAVFNRHVKETNHIGLCIIETPRLKTPSGNIQDNNTAELSQEEETYKIETEKCEAAPLAPSENIQVDIIPELPKEDDIIAELPQEDDIIAELPQEDDIVAESSQEEEETNKKEIIQMKKFVCLKCPKKFHTKMSVLRHQKTHSDSRPFQCDICLAKFKRKFSMHIHKTTHTKDRPFKCHKCPKRFTIGRSLQMHLMIHDGLKPYSCSICKKSFIQQSNLKIHKRIHTGDRPYVCLRCGSSFKTSSQCHLHQKTHTTEEVSVIKKKVPVKKNIECKICGRLFAQRSNMRKHLRIHTGEKPYACNLCPLRFSDSSNFKKHKRNHPKGKKSKSKSNPNSLLKSNLTEVSSTNPDPDPDGLIAAASSASESFRILEDIALPNVNNALMGLIDEDDGVKNLNKWNSDVIVTDIPNDENAIVQQQKQQEMLMNQLFCISYQDPMNPVGNKTTFYVVNQGN